MYTWLLKCSESWSSIESLDDEMIASDITRGNSVKIQTIYHISLFMNFLRFYAALNTEDKVKERKEGPI